MSRRDEHPVGPIPAEHLRDKVCVVTGASSGIGLAIAENLAERGARVVGLARRFEASTPIGRLEPGAVVTASLDVTDEGQVRARFSEIMAQCGPGGGIDVLINSAGSGQFGPFLATRAADLRTLLEVHVTGTFLCSREALRIMKERQRGHIVNIGSMAAVKTFADCAAYTAAKAGQRGLGRVLAHEARPLGVKVTTLMAGAVDTAIWNQRPGFDRGQMMNADDLADLVAEVIARPALAVEEIVVAPPAGEL